MRLRPHLSARRKAKASFLRCSGWSGAGSFYKIAKQADTCTRALG